MKQLKMAATIAFASVLMACEPAVTFTEPQPANTKNIPAFPKRLKGQYFNPENNSFLLIENNLIQRSYDYDRTLHRNQLDSFTKVVNDTLVNQQTGEHTPLSLNGDSVTLHIHCVDTLFAMDYDNVVRKFKGYYFINTRYGKTSWEVKKIKLHKGELSIGSITGQADINNLQDITESALDTIVPYHFTPTKKQFKEYVNNEGFADEEVFHKIQP